MRCWIAGFAVPLTLLAAAPATANPVVAAQGAGGLVLGRADVVDIRSRTVQITRDTITVEYEIENRDHGDVTTTVSFPMPDVHMQKRYDWLVPVQDANFLGVSVEVNGEPVAFTLEQRAITPGGIDMTAMIEATGFSVAPFGSHNEPIDINPFDPGAFGPLLASGAVTPWPPAFSAALSNGVVPNWTLTTRLHWSMTLAEDERARITTRFTPVLAGRPGMAFAEEPADEALRADHAARFCVDDAFIERVRALLARADDDGVYYAQSWLRYGSDRPTWEQYHGWMGRSRIVVDSGNPGALVSFCAEDIEQTGPTTYEAVEHDVDQRDGLYVLFIEPRRR